MSKNILLKMQGITKAFPGSLALNQVDFELNEGEVHVLCGENGAGKSTLMKILAGLYEPTSGIIELQGKKVSFHSPSDSEHNGIAIVHQELSLCPTVSVAENIFLTTEPTRYGIMLNRKKMNEDTRALFALLNCEIDPSEKLVNLTIAHQQLVQIAKALSGNAKILIMDEPFSSLSDEESNTLFGIMDTLRTKGVGIIYIDHRIDNFYKIGDRVTVLRDGKKIGVKELSEVTREQIISMMVGRDLNDIYPKFNNVEAEVKLEVKGLASARVSDISFAVRRGEIFGLGGLVGAGRTEVFKAIFGTDKKTAGSITINGKEVRIKNPVDSIRNGVAFIPENRKLEGLCISRSIRFNTTLIYIDKLKRMLKIDTKREKALVQEQIKALHIKIGHMNDLISSLSGGNQQKVVLAKWMMLDKINVLLLDEPTRGIDVGAKYEIYKLINELANTGIAIILVTSELPELINLCDRVAVMKNGKISGLLEKDDLQQEKIMALCI